MPNGSSSNTVDATGKSCYNSYMHPVTVTGPSKATNAANWLTQNKIEQDSWQMDLVNPFGKNPGYTFWFKDSKTAVEFALKWL